MTVAICNVDKICKRLRIFEKKSQEISANVVNIVIGAIGWSFSGIFFQLATHILTSALKVS